MGAKAHLAGYGVTMEVARDFIMSNYESNLGEVYNTCKEFGVNNDMIAEILGTVIPGVNGTIVSSFFDSAGFSGHSLGFNTDTTASTPSPASGTLNLGNLNSFSKIIMYENASESLINIIASSTYEYMYADASTWDGIRDIGFTSNYTLHSGTEVSYSSDYSSVAIGVDLKTVSESPYGGIEFDTHADTLIGNFDLIVAMTDDLGVPSVPEETYTPDSTEALIGNLDVNMLSSYSEVSLYENVSLSYITNKIDSSSVYLYSDAATIPDISVLGLGAPHWTGSDSGIALESYSDGTTEYLVMDYSATPVAGGYDFILIA